MPVWRPQCLSHSNWRMCVPHTKCAAGFGRCVFGARSSLRTSPPSRLVTSPILVPSSSHLVSSHLIRSPYRPTISPPPDPHHHRHRQGKYHLMSLLSALQKGGGWTHPFPGGAVRARSSLMGDRVAASANLYRCRGPTGVGGTPRLFLRSGEETLTSIDWLGDAPHLEPFGVCQTDRAKGEDGCCGRPFPCQPTAPTRSQSFGG